jgi:hypothetical protein
MRSAALVAYQTYMKARDKALDEGAEPSDWPEWDDLPATSRIAMIAVSRRLPAVPASTEEGR